MTMTKLLRGMHNFFIKILYKLIVNFAKPKRFRDRVRFSIDCANLNLNPSRLSICHESKMLPCIYYYTLSQNSGRVLQESRILFKKNVNCAIRCYN